MPVSPKCPTRRSLAQVSFAAAYLGMTVATLEKHYGHYRPDYQAIAARAIAKRVGAHDPLR
jgi:hypothetical protein